jgi:hypothetical protein
MICLLALMEVEILAIFLGEIETTAGKWMAKMRKPFASNTSIMLNRSFLLRQIYIYYKKMESLNVNNFK